MIATTECLVDSNDKRQSIDNKWWNETCLIQSDSWQPACWPLVFWVTIKCVWVEIPTVPAAGSLFVLLYDAGRRAGLPVRLVLLLNEADPSQRRRPRQWFKMVLLNSSGRPASSLADTCLTCLGDRWWRRRGEEERCPLPVWLSVCLSIS